MTYYNPKLYILIQVNNDSKLVSSRAPESVQHSYSSCRNNKLISVIFGLIDTVQKSQTLFQNIEYFYFRKYISILKLSRELRNLLFFDRFSSLLAHLNRKPFFNVVFVFNVHV
ncbi:hypothetical protein GQR58_019804 [Nymphon striatum]|nr:hypothetical protein GQR58_019804 [Nymphon striatum]